MTETGATATTEAKPLRYRRILLKLSGEALLGDRQYGVDPAVCVFIARQVAEIHGLGVQSGIVVGSVPAPGAGALAPGCTGCVYDSALRIDVSRVRSMAFEGASRVFWYT